MTLRLIARFAVVLLGHPIRFSGDFRQRRGKRLCACVVVLSAIAWSTSAPAQVNIGAGGGFSVPVEDAGDGLDIGWNLGVRGGLNVGSHATADLDFNYSHFGLNNTALALFGEPGGNVGVWSLTFQPQWYLAPRRAHTNVYATGGFGIFHRNLSLTQPSLVTGIICDPFFGCYPATFGANVVVASFSTVKPGFNVGAGLEYRLGESHVHAFAETRYQRMFTSNASDFTYLPVTFGLRW
jgi:hypothetical protein